MNLQNHFALDRFFNYLKYDLRLNAKTYLYIIIALIISLFFADLFSITQKYGDYNHRDYTALFFVTFTISSILIIGTSFPSLRKKKETSNYLLLPASTFEKFLVQFLIRIVVYGILFFTLFWIEFKFTTIIYQSFEWKRMVTVGSFDLFTPFNALDKTLDLLAVIFGIFSVAIFAFMGAVYFKKYALFKTIIIFCLLMATFFLTMVLFSHIFYPEKTKDFFQIKLTDYKITNDLYNVQLFLYVLVTASSLFFLPITYYKLKEKEA